MLHSFCFDFTVSWCCLFLLLSICHKQTRSPQVKRSLRLFGFVVAVSSTLFLFRWLCFCIASSASASSAACYISPLRSLPLLLLSGLFNLMSPKIGSFLPPPSHHFQKKKKNLLHWRDFFNVLQWNPAVNEQLSRVRTAVTIHYKKCFLTAAPSDTFILDAVILDWYRSAQVLCDIKLQSYIRLQPVSPWALVAAAHNLAIHSEDGTFGGKVIAWNGFISKGGGNGASVYDKKTFPLLHYTGNELEKQQ